MKRLCWHLSIGKVRAILNLNSMLLECWLNVHLKIILYIFILLSNIETNTVYMYNRYDSKCPKSGKKLTSDFDGQCRKPSIYIFFFPIFSIYLETNSSCTILSVNDRLNCSRKLECFGKMDTSSSHSSALSSPSQDLLPVSRTFLLYHRLHWTFGLLMSATEHFLSHQFRSSFR